MPYLLDAEAKKMKRYNVKNKFSPKKDDFLGK